MNYIVISETEIGRKKMTTNDLEDTFRHVISRLPKHIAQIIEQPQSAHVLVNELPAIQQPENLLHFPGQAKPKEIEIWNDVGYIFRTQGRYFDALSIYFSLFDEMLLGQEKTGKRGHKGLPLIWIYECYLAMNMPVHAKRFLMMTLVEDSISEEGKISPEKSGVYFRLVWRHGLAHVELERYSTQIYNFWLKEPTFAFFPERVLQEIDQDWKTEFPSAIERNNYIVNPRYINFHMDSMGDGTGGNLEFLAEYLMSCMPGCRTRRHVITNSTEYDVLCSMDGIEIDFRSEFGRYFVCECKDWNKAVGYTAFAKFCRVLDSVKSKFGIIFSTSGLSGSKSGAYASNEQSKVFQDRGMVIIIITKDDIKRVSQGLNFINMLRSKYESVRLDLP